MSSFYIDDNGLFNYNDYFYPIGTCNSPVNIIKAEILYKEKTYFITQPIITARTNFNYSIKVNKDSGFNFVQYNSEGRYPHFKDKYFELELKKQNQVISDYNGFKINWNILGQIYNIEDNKWKDIILLEEQSDKLNINQKHFLPVEEYLGECLSVAIQADIRTTAGSLIGQIHIPIHYYLNRQINSAIGGWDGNSIQLDKDGGYILTPQIGAGKKENDNSFTGMVMGRSKNSNSSVEKTGLLGYNKGEQSLFLDSESGGAIFGENKGGQIIIDPINEKGSLYSHDYWKQYNEKGFPLNYQDSNLNKKGLLIDLDTPGIKYGNEKFEIDKDGNAKLGSLVTPQGAISIIQSLGFSSVNVPFSMTSSFNFEPWHFAGYGWDPVPGILSTFYIQDIGVIIDFYLPEKFLVKEAKLVLNHAPFIFNGKPDAWTEQNISTVGCVPESILYIIKNPKIAVWWISESDFARSYMDLSTWGLEDTGLRIPAFHTTKIDGSHYQIENQIIDITSVLSNLSAGLYSFVIRNKDLSEQYVNGTDDGQNGRWNATLFKKAAEKTGLLQGSIYAIGYQK